MNCSRPALSGRLTKETATGRRLYNQCGEFVWGSKATCVPIAFAPIPSPLDMRAAGAVAALGLTALQGVDDTLEILEYLAAAWRNDRQKIDQSSEAVIRQLQEHEHRCVHAGNCGARSPYRLGLGFEKVCRHRTELHLIETRPKAIARRCIDFELEKRSGVEPRGAGL